MTHEYNPFWQQRIRETVLRALDVHPPPDGIAG